MKILERLERTFSWAAIPNLMIYIIIGQVVVWLLQWFVGYDVDTLRLVPAYVMKGEVWRLFTFIFCPPQVHPIFLIFAWLILFMTGSTMEQFWGTFKFNCYVYLGLILTLLAAVASAFIYPYFAIPSLFITSSIFLAFAYVNPNYEFMLFFVLPVKVKWLAILALAAFSWEILTAHLVIKIAVAAGVGNYLIFFGKDMIQTLKAKQRREDYARKQTAASGSDGDAFHTCSVCGLTDIDDPDMDFVYSDGKGYCQNCVDKVEQTNPSQG